MSIDVPRICDRMASKLYDGPKGRQGLIDIAAVLLSVCHEVRRAADEIEALGGDSRYPWLVKLAMSACVRHLRRVGASASLMSEDQMARTVDRVLHIVTTSTRMLETASSRSRRSGW